MNCFHVVSQQEGTTQDAGFGKLAAFYIGRFFFQHLVACQSFCHLLLVELYFRTHDQRFFCKWIVRIFKQFSGVEEHHIIILLLISNLAEIIMRIQAKCSFREGLQIFIKAALGFFCSATCINLFSSSIGQRILLAGIKTDMSRHRIG